MVENQSEQKLQTGTSVHIIFFLFLLTLHTVCVSIEKKENQTVQKLKTGTSVHLVFFLILFESTHCEVRILEKKNQLEHAFVYLIRIRWFSD